MPFTGNYTITQTTNTTSFVLEDTSSYADEAQGTFSGRRIYIFNNAGENVVPEGTTTDYVDFPFSMGNTITITVLLRDYAFNVEMDWISLAPQPGSTYTLTELFGFTGNTVDFIYGLVQQIQANPSILSDTGFYDNLSKLYTEVDNTVQAVTYGDIQSAQGALDRAFYLITNSNKFF
jgi:hypothetical protein